MEIYFRDKNFIDDGIESKLLCKWFYNINCFEWVKESWDILVNIVLIKMLIGLLDLILEVFIRFR